MKKLFIVLLSVMALNMNAQSSYSPGEKAGNLSLTNSLTTTLQNVKTKNGTVESKIQPLSWIFVFKGLISPLKSDQNKLKDCFKSFKINALYKNSPLVQ